MMETETPSIKQILFQRLENKGIGPRIIPGLIRDLANLDVVDPRTNLFQVNKRLNYLGWGDVELDYHTLQLVIACMEAGMFKRRTYGITLQ
jgi:hypothetical protein